MNYDLATIVPHVPHPPVALLYADYPVDAIWRGVLDADDAALAGVDLDAGAVRLLTSHRAVAEVRHQP
jgi:hypothetical protein